MNNESQTERKAVFVWLGRFALLLSAVLWGAVTIAYTARLDASAAVTLRIDQIWLSPQWKAIDVYSLRTKHSDHRMVVCDVRLCIAD